MFNGVGCAGSVCTGADPGWPVGGPSGPSKAASGWYRPVESPHYGRLQGACHALDPGRSSTPVITTSHCFILYAGDVGSLV